MIMSNLTSTIGFIISFFKSKRISLITAFVCWDQSIITKMVIELSKENIRTQIINLRHVNVDMLPNDSKYRVGIVFDVNCNINGVLNRIPHDEYFDNLHHWLLIDDCYNKTKTMIFMETLDILPNSEVVWSCSNKELFDVYKIKKNTDLKLLKLITISENDRNVRLKWLWLERGPSILHRKDLKSVNLTCTTVITVPSQFTSMDDLKLRHIDTWTKSNFPIVQLLAEDLNFRLNLSRMDNFGWEINGSFDGLMGKLQRKEIEFGVTGAFMRSDRMKACDYTAATFQLRACIIFRTPSLSTIRNIFQLPFGFDVWLACIFLCVLITIQLFVEFVIIRRYYLRCEYIPLIDLSTFIVGAFCQQGFYRSSKIMSIRIIFICTFVASVFLYTSYSANIVSLLQRPSLSIRTIKDLAYSPLSIGIQDTMYNKIYFMESNDKEIQLFNQKKIIPQGSKAYMHPKLGVEMIQKELFAFQVETSAAYKWISETYTEAEKCQLIEIEAFSLPPLAIPMVKRSAYKELFAQRLVQQRSAGLITVWRHRWVATAPKCAEGAMTASFKSVALHDFLPALEGFIYGSFLAILIFIIEIAIDCALNLIHRT